MNWSMAIWAVASCMATRSGRSASMALPRSQTCVSQLSTWETRIFSVRVRPRPNFFRSEEHTSELQSQSNLVCRLLLEKKKKKLFFQTRYLFFHLREYVSLVHDMARTPAPVQPY